MNAILGVLAVFALVFANGFFVAAEFSLVGARRTRITQLANEGNPGARAAEHAIEHLDSYIAATQLGITLASLGLGWIGEPAIARLFDPLLEAFLSEHTVETIGHTLGIVVAFAIVTLLHIVLGELAPKSIALQRPEATSILVARPTAVFLRLFRPIIWVMNTIGNSVVRLLGFEPASGHAQVHSAEELEMLVHASREAGILQASEELLLRRVFDFSDIHAEEIMQPRVDVEAFPLNISLSDLLTKIASVHHSRYPVYEDNIDNVIGILHIKDLFNRLVEQPELLTTSDRAFDIKPLLREPLFVPGTVGVDALLERMQKTKTHIAIIIDEYGGVAGLTSMEDIFEELVGEVQDEFDLEENPIVSEGEVTVVEGGVSLSDIMERFGELEPEPESSTIGGYVSEQLHRIPVVGDRVRYGDYDLRVIEMEGMRVSKVRFIRRKSSTNDQTATSTLPKTE